MNLDHLHYFEAVARLQHYGRAAQELHVSQPALNYAISQLETELGVPLFERQGRGIRLTRYGDLFLQSVRGSLLGLDTGVRAVQELAQGGGLVMLGGIRRFAARRIPALMQEFLMDDGNRGVRFELHTGTGFTADLIQSVIDEQLDVAFVSHPGDPARCENVAFANAPFVIVVPPTHPLAQYVETGVTLADTLCYPYICFSQKSGLRRPIDQLFYAIGVTPRIVCETEEDSVIAGLTAAGFGITILPDDPELHHGEFAVVPIREPDPARTAYLVRKRAAVRPVAADRFWEFCLQRLPLMQGNS